MTLSMMLLLFCSWSHSNAACLSLSLSLYCMLSALSLPVSLSTPPFPISSRNWSGSGSCRSMEIWVRTVYVIVASINALLICSGLQPSIHVIHPHARPSPNCCFTHTYTPTHTSEKAHGQAERTQQRGKQQHERRQEQEGQQQGCGFTSLFVSSLSTWPSAHWSVIYTYQYIYIQRTVIWNCKQRYNRLSTT